MSVQFYNRSLLTVFPAHSRLISRVCFKTRPRPRKAIKELSPKKTMLVNSLHSAFNSSEFLAVFHYNNMSIKDWNNIRSQLDGKEITMRVVPSEIAKKTLQDTKYENALSLFYGSTAIAYSHQPRLAELFAVTKKEPRLLLLGGLVENELMTPFSLQRYSELPTDRTVLHQQLLGTLMMPLMGLSNVINGNSVKLVQILQHHH